MSAKKKGGEGDVLNVVAVGAKNLTPNKKGTADPFAVVTSTFNKQRFKSKPQKKTLAPTWSLDCKFFTTVCTGHVNVKVWDKDRWGRDTLLGEVNVPCKQLDNGEEVDQWYPLENEPKKKQGDKGEVRLKLHFPTGNAPGQKASPASPEAPKVAPQTAEKRKVHDCFEIEEELGRGGFSIVKKAKRKETGEVFAIKIIEKNQAEEELQLLQREIDIMRKLRHKNIISLEEVYDEPDYIYLVMELVTGGELFDQIVSRGTYSERDAANVIRQILEAVEYMHRNGIAHRDLKPENLLCSGPSNELIKVTDFGLSKDFGKASLKTSCGTPDYVAPEVLKGSQYDNSVDIWSIGVITYILLCGFPPFYGNNDQQIFEKILKAEYDFPSPDWDSISHEAKEFISAILVLDCSNRPTAIECLEAPWIVSKAPNQALNRLESFRTGMSAYTGKRKGA